MTMTDHARKRLHAIPGLTRIVETARQARQVGTRLAVHALTQRRAHGRRQIEAYIREHGVRKLQLGTGSNPYEGWLNTDVLDFRERGEIVYLDARKPFPIPDSSFDLIFSEHMIEHMSYQEGLCCLKECWRVLRPDGRIRVATPGVDRLVRLYDPQPTELTRRYIRWSVDAFVDDRSAYLSGFVINNMFRNFGHKFVYDTDTLRHALERAGFVDVEEWAVGVSGDERLAGLERHMSAAAEFNAFETIVLEARRP